MKPELNPCPNCNSLNVEVNGDDFDADVYCNDCSLCTPVCFGINTAVNVWNGRVNTKKWSFLKEQTMVSYYI
jgi:hypothetical protein